MRIEFCSLCDESVPLPDLDKGIAVKTKGRVICAHCEAAMSSGEPAAPQPMLQFMGSAVAPGTPLERGGDTTVMESAHGLHRGRTSRAPAPGALGGMLFAAFTLLVIGGLAAGFHFYDQYQLERSAAAGELKRLASIVDQNAASQDRRLRSALREGTAELPATIARVSKLEAQLAGLVGVGDDDLSSLRAELQRLEARLRGVDVQLERLDGNERDLAQLALSMADVFDQVLGLQRRLDTAEALASAMPLVTAEAARQVQPAAAPWLGQLPGLEDSDPGARWLAVTAIGEFGDPACAAHLIPRLKDEDVFVRMAAARILGDIKATHAIEALIDALEDEQNTVRQAAMLALRSLTGESLKFDADEVEGQRAKRVKAWREWWKKNKSKFIEE